MLQLVAQDREPNQRNRLVTSIVSCETSVREAKAGGLNQCPTCFSFVAQDREPISATCSSLRILSRDKRYDKLKHVGHHDLMGLIYGLAGG